MSDQVVQITAGSGTKVDVEELTVGANTVERQRVVVTGTAAAEIGAVKNADPTSSTYGAVVRPAPGEVHMGEVGGAGGEIVVTPVVSTSPAYSSGDAVGGKQTLTNAVRISGGRALLESIMITDLGNKKRPLDILIFDSDPSGSTITDNSAFAFSTGLAKLKARIQVAAADYDTVNSVAIANLGNLGRYITASGSRNLYVALVDTTGVAAYATTSDLVLAYQFMWD